MPTNRREFAKAAALTALSYQRVLGANDRVRLGFIGVGFRGDQVLRAFTEYADQQIAAVCDIRRDYMDLAAQNARTNPDKVRDFRRIIERNDIDAVVISTPDHWHAIQTIQACGAGKDVYVEKPLSLTVVEGRKMVEAARRNNRVVQVGIHRRSSPYCKEAAEAVRSGEIGPVTVARCYHIQNEWPLGIGDPANAAPPEGVDWDMYLGPAPEQPYNRNKAFYNFRWFYNFSGGQLTNNGVHFMDLIQWSLGQDAPLAVTAIGGKLAVRDDRQIPDTLEVLWEFPGATIVKFSQHNCTAAPVGREEFYAEFRGTKGTLLIQRGGYKIIPEENNTLEAPVQSPVDRAAAMPYRTAWKPAMEAREGKGSEDTRLHARNFLDCIKSRERPNCDVETGHRSTTATILGNIAHKTQSHLKWDRQGERFTNSDDANSLLHYTYRAPWKLG